MEKPQALTGTLQPNEISVRLAQGWPDAGKDPGLLCYVLWIDAQHISCSTFWDLSSCRRGAAAGSMGAPSPTKDHLPSCSGIFPPPNSFGTLLLIPKPALSITGLIKA